MADDKAIRPGSSYVISSEPKAEGGEDDGDSGGGDFYLARQTSSACAVRTPRRRSFMPAAASLHCYAGANVANAVYMYKSSVGQSGRR